MSEVPDLNQVIDAAATLVAKRVAELRDATQNLTEATREASISAGKLTRAANYIALALAIFTAVIALGTCWMAVKSH